MLPPLVISNLFLRNFDFQLFHIQREHWLRKNDIATFDSAPQLIWGNVVFLLSKQAFLKRLKVSSNRETLFAKYLLIAMAYRLYDYAYELCEEVDLPISAPFLKALSSFKISKKELVRLLFSLLAGFGRYTLSFSASSKQNRSAYLIRKARKFGQACLHLSRNHFAFYD
jgi:hypothetical protein